MENKKPVLPVKLPPSERKKLTLLIDTTNQCRKDEEHQQHNISQNNYCVEVDQTKSDEDIRFSNDNNAYFVEQPDECTLENESLTDESSINDSNCYLNLNKFRSKDLSNISSEISNPTPNESLSVDEDEEFILPSGLIPEPEAITPSSEEAPSVTKPVQFRPAHPTLPKKMSKKEIQESFRRINTLANSVGYEDDSYSYCRPSELQLSTFKLFRDEIFRNNNLCADCQRNTPTCLSCKYFITLCEQCSGIHLKLPHHVNKFYIIEFKKLYDELTKSTTDVSIDSFLKILAEAGNEKMNSLFEFEAMQAKRNENIADFIKEKYLNKSFLDLHEIHYTSNYIDICNQTFSIQGLCIPIIIYNLFIGANINYSNAMRTAFDIACEISENTPQQNYFKLNSALSFSEIDQSILEQEFQGDLLQVMEMSPAIQTVSIVNALKKHPIRLNLTKHSIRLIKNNAKTEIDHLSLIKIESHLKLNLIEVKWCNKANNSLMSTYFEYSSGNEKNIWMREFYFKLLAQLNLTSLFEDSQQKQSFLSLIDLIRACQINLIGHLNLNKYELVDSDRDEGHVVVAALVESLEAQKHEFFQRKLVLIDSTCEINIIDLRKIRIKLKDNLIRIDYENKCFVLKSFGYLQHLKTWHDTIVAKSQMNNTCLNDQYLTRENVPVFVEKVCSFVEFNYVLQEEYYSLANLNKPQKQLNLDVHERELAAENIIQSFKLYFSTYFTADHSTLLIKSFGKFFDQSIKEPLRDYLSMTDFTSNKISFSSLVQKEDSKTRSLSHTNLDLVNLDKLKTFLYKLSQTNSTFYYTLRRMAIHLSLISIYKEKNKMNEQYLSQLFASIIFNTANLSSALRQSLGNLKLDVSFMNENVLIFLFAKLLEAMMTHCTYLFNLKEQYLKTQLKMIERSFDLNKINLSKQPVESDLKYLITIYYESKSSGKAFNLKIDAETTVDSLLDSLSDLKDFKENLNLFEIFDNEQYKSLAFRAHPSSRLDDIALVRLFPSNLKLLDNLSKWNSFYLCLKQSEVKSLEAFSLSENNYEKCEFIIQCKNCGCFSLNDNSLSDCSSHKWRHCYLVVKNDTIRIYKRTQSEHSHQQEDYSKLKQLAELKLDDLIFYYGLYYWSETASLSSSRISSMFPNEIKIADNECASLFDKRTNQLYSFHFKDSTTCMSLYKDLFEKMYQETCSQLGLFSKQTRYVSIWPSESAFSTNSISRMFRKIIKK